MKKGVLIIGILFLVVFLITNVHAATYYVDATSGLDSNLGTSEANAWRTISKINSGNFQPGDNILFKRGEIWRERLVPPSSGSPGNYITFGAYGSGEKPIIRGTENHSFGWTNDLIHSNLWRKPFNPSEQQMAYGSYYGAVFEDNKMLINEVPGGSLEHCNNNPGCYYYDYSNDIMYIHTTGSDDPSSHTIEITEREAAISIYGKSYLIIENLNLFQPGKDGIYIDDNSASVPSYSNNIIIKNNWIDGCGRYLLDFVDWKNEENNREIDIYYNYLGRAGVAAIAGAGIQDSRFYNNVISDAGYVYLTRGCGFSFSDAGPGISIINNVIFEPKDCYVNIWQGQGPIQLDNNCYYSESQKGWSDDNHQTEYYLLSEWQNSIGQDANSISADPLFVSPSTNDFHPQSGSPAIDAGVDVGLTQDFDGNPIVGVPDIGAYEFQGTASSQELIAHYKFDEGTGTIAQDSSGNNNDGMVNGATWTNGIIGGALSFDGSNDYVDFTSFDDDMISNRLTTSVWFKFIDFTSENYQEIYMGSNWKIYMDVYNLGEFMRCSFVIQGSSEQISSVPVEANKWYHAVCIYNGNSIKLYLNNSLVGEDNIITTPNGDIDDFNSSGYPGIHIGKHRTSNIYNFNGMIDDVRIYNYELSSQEILDLYNQGLQSTCSPADTSGNSVIEIGELLTYISSWKAGTVIIGDLLTAIGEWKNGC